MTHYAIILAAALLAGMSNALAGGGTFLTFPALLLIGVAPVEANATSSLAMVPGAIVSAWVYRDTIRNNTGSFLAKMLGLSLVGSAIGSALLLRTSNADFAALVPWLLLGATLVFTLAPRIRKWAAGAAGHLSSAALLGGQFLISIYGGYFGAGMGVLMIALYLAATKLDVHASSGLRILCACSINMLAVVIFGARGALNYRLGIPMLIAGVVGGYFGAILVRKLNAETARKAILAYAWALTAWFFAKMLL